MRYQARQVLLVGVLVLLPLLLLGSLAAPAKSLPIIETFDTDTLDVTDGSYPDFTLNVGVASVIGGILQLTRHARRCASQSPGTVRAASVIAGETLAAIAERGLTPELERLRDEIMGGKPFPMPIKTRTGRPPKS